MKDGRKHLKELCFVVRRKSLSNSDPLDLIQRDLATYAAVKFCCPWRFVGRNTRLMLQFAGDVCPRFVHRGTVLAQS